MTLVAGLCGLLLAAVHVLVGGLRFLDVVPRSRWLSFAGGVAVAYVFLHLLPELSAHRERLAGVAGDLVEQSTFIVALAGLAVFYGLERAIKLARGAAGDAGRSDAPATGVFWLHLGSFGLYNVVIGYLLQRASDGWRALTLYAVAMALHFVTNDFGLRQDYRGAWDRIGRWLLAAAVLAGAAAGAWIHVSEATVAVLFAFLAGGVVLNVLKEELPEERRSRFGPFLSGVVGYGALLVALE